MNEENTDMISKSVVAKGKKTRGLIVNKISGQYLSRLAAEFML